MFTIGASSAAFAHANYLRSDPPPNAHLNTPPTRVLVGFSEKVQVSSSGLILLDQSGREVAMQSGPTSDPTELALPLPALSDGVYAVAWHTVSAEDGDSAKGYFAFEVGQASAVSAPPLTQTASTPDGIRVDLSVSPDLAGKNGYQVTLTRGSAAVSDVTRVRLRFTPLDRDIGQTELILASSSAGVFAGNGFELPISGRYRIQVQLRRSGLDDVMLDLDFMVSNAVASPSPSVPGSSGSAAPTTPSATPVPASAPVVSPALLVAGVLLVLALAAFGLSRARRRA